MADSDDKRGEAKKLLKETFDEWFTEKQAAITEANNTRTEADKKKSGGLLDTLFGG